MNMADMILRDKVSVVTGAGRGIGRAIALSVAAEGSKVVVNALRRSDGYADATAQEIIRKGGQAIACYADVSDFEQARKLVQTTVEVYGKIDILVNNAGITGWRMPWDISGW